MTHCISTSSTMSTTASTPVSKKSRRFSLIRLFNNNGNSSSSSSSGASSTSSSGASSPSNSPRKYRHSMDPTMEDGSMQTELMRERRKSIAALTENSLRSMSLDLRPSAIRPILSRKETPQIEMTEKMRQFDELLQTRRSSTIRITLTPSLLQEP